MARSNSPARVPSLNPSDVARSFRDITASIRDLSARIAVIEQSLQRAGITMRQGVIASGETAVLPGKLLHVTQSGQVFLATASSASRWATDVAVSVSGSVVTFTSWGEFDLYVTSDTIGAEPPKLFLSTVKGFCTANPGESGAVIQQLVGFQRAARGSSGKCASLLSLSRHVLL